MTGFFAAFAAFAFHGGVSSSDTLPDNYESRSAAIGSIRVARADGTATASSATAARIRETTRYTRGSLALDMRACVAAPIKEIGR